MDIQRTIRLKLNCPVDTFLPTVQAYTKAYNYVCQIAWNDNKNTNGVELHHETYKTVRKYLTADLAISARTKAVESIKSAKTKLRKGKEVSCPESRLMSIRYNDKTFNVWFEKNIISLQTINGRIKIPITIPEYYQEYITWRRRSAELIIRNDKIFLNIVFQKSIPDPVTTGKTLGIDRGIKQVAVTSDKRFYGSGHVRRVSKRYQRLRSILQSKKHSGKRHLSRLSRKENRFCRDANHCISKKIVSSLKSGDTIVFEDLTNINNTVPKGWTDKHKSFNRNRMSWSFKQLEDFVAYKAFSEGIDVGFVKPKDTSRRCSRCGHVSERNRPYQCLFRCLSCGYQCNADLNASFNIVSKYQDSKSYPDRGVVNHPGVPEESSGSSVVASSAPCGRSN